MLSSGPVPRGGFEAVHERHTTFRELKTFLFGEIIKISPPRGLVTISNDNISM